MHTRYDFLSVIRSMELILGMKPLGLFDELATPMYDAFQARAGQRRAATTAIPPKVSLTETQPVRDRGGARRRAAAEVPGLHPAAPRWTRCCGSRSTAQERAAPAARAQRGPARSAC